MSDVLPSQQAIISPRLEKTLERSGSLSAVKTNKAVLK